MTDAEKLKIALAALFSIRRLCDKNDMRRAVINRALVRLGIQPR
jgi:hypothetical protein